MLGELLRRGNLASADLRCIEVSRQLQTRVGPSQVACLGAVKYKGRKPKGNVHQPSELKRGHAVVTTWGPCIMLELVGAEIESFGMIILAADSCRTPKSYPRLLPVHSLREMCCTLLNKVVCAQAQ